MINIESINLSWDNATTINSLPSLSTKYLVNDYLAESLYKSTSASPEPVIKRYIPSYTIIDIEILIPNKVMKVYFYDGTYIKVVCHVFDDFDLERGCYIALAKKFYSKTHTVEGIEYMATQLSYQKKYANIVNKAVKEYEKKTMLAWKEAIASKREEAIAANKKRKREAYIKRRDERRRQARIDEMAEAFKKAMKE